MVAGGVAIGRDGEGRVVLVEGALPGETVTVRLTEERRDYARAVTVAVDVPSPDRVEAPCAARAAGCGGCPWQHVAPAAQPRLKAAIVADALRRTGGLADPPEVVVAPVAVPVRRTTARLAVGASGRAGHRPAGGRAEAVPTDACLVAHPLLEELMVTGRFPDALEVVLRVSAATGERVARVDRAAAVARVRVPDDVVVVGPDRSSSDPGAVHEEVAGRRFRVDIDTFFQPGPAAAEALVEAVIAAAGDALVPGAHLLDAYAGAGLFGSVLGAAYGLRVTAVESARPAVADARHNLADVDARVLATEVGRWRPRRGDPVDVVVADPARSGLGRPGVSALAATGARRLVLVSCDPASLGRDVKLLAAAGYGLVSVSLLDTFPHTFHTETVARFEPV